MKTCRDCGSPKSDKGEYCKSCGYKHRKRPSGLNYKIVNENRGWFKKGDVHKYFGHIPWNKGTKGWVKPNKGSFVKGQTLEKSNVNWKGDGVGYFALHTWVYRRLGKASKCTNCGSERNVEWANKSHKYLRDTNDWISLCKRCHVRYDMDTDWGVIPTRFLGLVQR